MKTLLAGQSTQDINNFIRIFFSLFLDIEDKLKHNLKKTKNTDRCCYFFFHSSFRS